MSKFWWGIKKTRPFIGHLELGTAVYFGVISTNVYKISTLATVQPTPTLTQPMPQFCGE